MIAKYLPWLLSCLTIFQLWMAGNKAWYAWLITLFNQILWFTWICASENWGLLPMNLAICFVAVRNHRRWVAAKNSDWPIAKLKRTGSNL